MEYAIYILSTIAICCLTYVLGKTNKTLDSLEKQVDCLKDRAAVMEELNELTDAELLTRAKKHTVKTLLLLAIISLCTACTAGDFCSLYTPLTFSEHTLEHMTRAELLPIVANEEIYEEYCF